MITYHGCADPLIFPQGSIDYFNRVVAANGGLKRVQEFDLLRDKEDENNASIRMRECRRMRDERRA